MHEKPPKKPKNNKPPGETPPIVEEASEAMPTHNKNFTKNINSNQAARDSRHKLREGELAHKIKEFNFNRRKEIITGAAKGTAGLVTLGYASGFLNEEDGVNLREATFPPKKKTDLPNEGEVPSSESVDLITNKEPLQIVVYVPPMIPPHVPEETPIIKEKEYSQLEQWVKSISKIRSRGVPTDESVIKVEKVVIPKTSDNSITDID